MNVDLEHTNQPGKCFADEINSLAEDCDNEYYMSAIGSTVGTLERAKRGLLRIREGIIDLERLSNNVSCRACHQEIEHQIKVQKDAILEIEKAWNLAD